MYHNMARDDFDRAYLKAFVRRVAGWFTGERNNLLPFDEVRNKIPVRGQHYRGLMQVPVEKIVGSVGRYLDFDRIFLPKLTITRGRWESIDRAYYEDIILPPVELYKIGELYFVKDGNHRVSVARMKGQVQVDAYVIEIDVPGKIQDEEDLIQLPLELAREEFLKKTKLLELRPDADVRCNNAANYEKLLEHISAHQWYLGKDLEEEISFERAVQSWYDTLYQPVVAEITKNQLLKEFPGSTLADIYLWIMDYQWTIRQAMKHTDDFKQAIQAIQEQDTPAPSRLYQVMERMELFDDILTDLDYARFMATTKLGQLRPGADIRTTIPGSYDKLLEHIEVHQWYLGEKLEREVSYEEAVLSWYDTIYSPLAKIVQQMKVLDDFPEKGEGDIVLWMVDRQWQAKHAMGQELSAKDALEDVVKTNLSPLQRWWRRIRGRGAKDHPEEPPSAT